MIAIKRMEEFKDIENLNSEIADINAYITTYCPDAYWILKFYGKKNRAKQKLKNMCELLID
jgi:ketosteroid isomerase-like protein